MGDQRLAGLGRVAAAVAVASSVAGVGILAALGRWSILFDDFVVHNAILGIGCGIVGWVAVARQPRHGAVWVLVASSVFAGLYAVLNAYLVVAVGNPTHAEMAVMIPADFSPIAYPSLPVSWVWLPAPFLITTLGLLLFPGGRYANAAGRAVGRLSVLVMIVGCASLAWTFRPSGTTPIGADSADFPGFGQVVDKVALVLILFSAYALIDAVRRYTRSTGEVRLQFRWVLAGTGALAAAAIAAVVTNGSLVTSAGTSTLIFAVGEGAVVAAFGIAITKHRLYDIDVVISKTLVFGALATFITGIYVLVVVGLGELVGGSSLWLSVAATAVAAVAFEPFRTRVQRWANRVVYGKRATPYEVLSEVSRRLAVAESEEGLLDRMATMLAAGTGAARTGVWSRRDGGFALVAAAPPAEGDGMVEEAALPGAVEMIRHEDEVIGALTVEMGRGEALSSTERSLVADLAGSAALVLRKARLDEALAARAGELEASRRRLVDAQDVERRRLERDLHDGAQQLVVALKVKLGLAEQLAAREGSEKAAGLLRQMADDTGLALDQIRSLAQGIYPPLLQADGLGAAIPALAALSSQRIDVDVDLAGRHPLEREGAVYFCVSEALTNAAKHARDPVTVAVSDGDGGLTFSVADSGPGFDPAAVALGSGLRNIRDRVEALGGTVTISSEPGGPTVIAGEFPPA